MVEAEVVTRRLLVLSQALAQLSRPQCGDPALLRTDDTLRAAVERWLQLAIEACIDVAFHAIAFEGWTPPESARSAFATLAAHGRLPLDLADRLGLAAGLRNVLVHDYVDVDTELLARAVLDDTSDLRAFAVIAGGWLRKGD